MSEEASKSNENDEKLNLTEQHFSLISQAYDEFNGKRYSQSLQTLINLEELIGNNDRKIAHNRAVVEFYNSDGKNYMDLFKFLNKEIFNYENNKDDDNEPKNSSRNMFVIYFNKAVLLYHMKKLYTAIDILSPLLEKIDELDESILIKSGLLLITLLLETNQLNKAYKFLKKFETYTGFSTDNLFSSTASNTDETNKKFDSDSKYNELKRHFKLVSLLTYIVNQKNIVIPDDMNIELSFLKAHQFYVGKDFQMAAKQLSKNFSPDSLSIESYGVDPNTCIANNMGVIHLRVRHYAIATSFFQHAVRFDRDVLTKLSQIERPLHLINSSKQTEILYNLGIALLHLQRPNDAFECFKIPLQTCFHNPRLWLRIAESCIMVHEKKIKGNERKGIFAGVIGSGIHRKYLLPPTPKILPEEKDSSEPTPTMEFAVECLINAITLTEEYKSKLIKQNQNINNESDEESWQNAEDANFCNPSMPISIESIDRLLSASYAAYSYASIRIGDYVIGLEYAKKLLAMENISDAHVMLGHLYCAEALINLNRLNEARAYLEPKFITNLNPHDFETKDWQINSLEAAQAVLKYNLVVTLVLQSEFGVAKALLVSCDHPVIATKCKMLKMFIELAEDNSIENIKLKFQRL